MSIEKRKIGFYSIQVTNTDKEIENPQIISDVFNFINTMSKEERIYDIKPRKKFHQLIHSNRIKSIENILFASGKYNHRPPLINKSTAAERENPKLLEEGEKELTHLALNYTKDEILVLIEERKAGISFNTFISYIKRYIRMYLNSNKIDTKYFLQTSFIPKGNFLEELKKLKRVTLGQVTTEKEVLGSEFLGLVDRVEQVSEDIVIQFRARRGLSILRQVSDVYQKLLGKRKKIVKIRAYGYSNEGNSVMLDTELLKKIEYVEVDLNPETGIVKSEQVFIKFKEILS